MKNIVIYPNPQRDLELKQTKAVVDILAKMSVGCRIITPYQSKQEIENAIKNAEMVITLGGDGTILHAARYAARLDVPILGINTGHKGFMAELERENIELVIDVLNGKYSIEQRMMLDAVVTRCGKRVYSDFSLNDVVISGKARILHMVIKGDGQVMTELSGDGVVVATPTGSTAYSMAAGGPIMEPSAENIIITPICAYELSAKSFVLIPERVIEIILKDKDNRNAYISSDGGESFDLQCGDTVSISRSKFVTSLVRVTDTSFYEKVSRKLRK